MHPSAIYLGTVVLSSQHYTPTHLVPQGPQNCQQTPPGFRDNFLPLPLLVNVVHSLRPLRSG